MALVLATVGGSFAESLPFRKYSSDDGLPQSLALSLAQDQDGYLWIGTAYGLSRFDGLEFQNLDAGDQLPDNVIRTMVASDQGLWIGTESGLGLVTDDGVALISGLEGQSVRDIVVESTGLWVATYGQGLVRVEDGHVVERFTSADGLPGDRVRALVLDRRGILWVGTFGGGISRFDGSSFRSYSADLGLGDDFVRDLYELDGEILVATNSGLWRGGDDGFVKDLSIPALENATISTIAIDHQDRLWVGTRDLGACWALEGESACWSLAQGLPDNSINDILEDREGNLWFATFGGGVARLATEAFRNLTTTDGLSPGGVHCFGEAGDELWLGSHGSGITRLDDHLEVIGHIDTTQGLQSDKVFTIDTSDDDAIWIGTLDGVSVWRNDKVEPHPLSPEDPFPAVYDIETVDSSRWFATLSGLYQLHPEGGRLWIEEDGMPDNRINDLEPNGETGLWVGTAEGVCLIDRNQLQECWNESDGLVEDYVTSLHVQPETEGVWIGTSRGLARLVDGRFTTWSTTEGLSHDKISVVLSDLNGFLWVGTTRGVNIFDGSTFRVFTHRDGLPSAEVIPLSGLVDSQQRIWLGNVRGASFFVPDALPRSERIPPVVRIHKAEVDREKVDITARVELEAGQSALQVEFLGLSLTYPESVRYLVRLDGLETRSTITRERTLSYPSLPSGNYKLEISSSLDGQNWSPPSSLALQVIPPLWQRSWFLAALAMLGLVCIVGIFRLRTASIRSNQRQLTRLVTERTAELEEQHREVEARNRQLQLTNTIVRNINEVHELDRVLQTIVEALCFAVSADGAIALLKSAEGDRFDTYAATGIDTMPGERTIDGAILRAELRRGNEVAGDLVACNLSKELEKHLGKLPRYLLALPLLADETTLGYVLLGRDGTGFTANAIKTLGPLRDHVLSAVLKGRLMRRLESLNATKDEFLGIAAHDLRSPLGGILGATDVLSKLFDEGRADSPISRRFLSNIRQVTKQMLTLVNDLLDVASIETGRIDLALEPLDLAEVLRERESLLRGTAETKKIHFEVAVPNAVPMIGDRVRLGEIFDNLISNAIKYTEPGGRVDVSAEADGDTVEISISDTGLGFEVDEISDVFAGRKLSARPTAGETSTGLGLVIVKKLVDCHGGAIRLESLKGKGSTFTLTFQPRPQVTS